MQDNAHETKEFHFRKVVKDFDPVKALSNINLFLPRPGETWVVSKVWTRIRDKSGVGSAETTPGQILLDNGTDGQNVVAAVTLPFAGAIGSVIERTVLPNITLTSAKPLRMKHTVLAVGTGGYAQRVDIIVTLIKLSEIA